MKTSRRLNAALLAVTMAVVGAPLAQMEAMASQAPTVASAGTKVVGAPTNAWGTAPRGASVWTEVQLSNGSWSVSQRRTTNSNGAYVIPLTYGANNVGSYRYRVGTNTSSGKKVYTSPFTLNRVARPSAHTAGTKTIGHTTNTWGTAPGGGSSVWTEVKLPNGSWSTSQRRTTNSRGAFTIPLTYGANRAGAYTYRIGSRPGNRDAVYSEPFTLHRVPRPTAHTAGTKPVGHTTNTWGHFPRGGGIEVWTEVHTGNGWSTSQRRKANSSGDFVIPLTYGASSAGSYRYRVAGRYPDGTVARSPEFTLKRTGVSSSGSKHDWMRAAGIPQAQWTYVDYIVSRESGWNPSARNPSSGACGLAQALPCSKVGANWNDPVTSLKWQYNYVKSRYGGYQGAYNFWLRNRWY